MKTAVIYYSYEGSTALVAELIREELKADIFEIKTRINKKRKGFAKYFWGGLEVVTHKKPALLPLSIDINKYDLVVLGSPVWAGSPSSPVFSFLTGTEIKGKKIALFCCCAGGKGKVFEKLKGLLPGNTFAGEIEFIKPSVKNSAKLKQKIGEWVKTLSSNFS